MMKKKELSPVTGLFSEQASVYVTASDKNLISNNHKNSKYGEEIF